MTNSDATLTGGPRDGETVATDGTGLLEYDIDGLVHRYIRTSNHNEATGAFAYNYDGVVDPTGAQDGAENAKDRQASPLADREGGQPGEK
jgi:hypothetical protein